MNKVPVGFDGSFQVEGEAPDNNNQSGGEYSGYGNTHSRLQGSDLPCPSYEKVHYQPNKPQCHPWNSPQCGYGCGTCAESDGCMNYPYSNSTMPTNFQPGQPSPICKMQMGGTSHAKTKPKKIPKPKRTDRNKVMEKLAERAAQGHDAMCDAKLGTCRGNKTNKINLWNASNIWYSQQCQCGNSGDCAGSGTVNGCGCGGGGCQDCDYNYRKQMTYRHMLKGMNYPFC